jgi:Ca2+-binding EF-hand superfamily protein
MCGQVLLAVATALHEKGVAAHGAIKHMMPEADGTVDEKELQTMLGRLGVPVSLAVARRLMSRADLMHDGRLTGWEFVRLLSFATEGDKA